MVCTLPASFSLISARRAVSGSTAASCPIEPLKSLAAGSTACIARHMYHGSPFNPILYFVPWSRRKHSVAHSPELRGIRG